MGSTKWKWNPDIEGYVEMAEEGFDWDLEALAVLADDIDDCDDTYEVGEEVPRWSGQKLDKMNLCRCAQYSHDVDKLEHAVLSSVEQNIFFYILARVRDHGDEQVVISYEAIRANAAYRRSGDRELEKTIHTLYRKMRDFDYVHIQSGKLQISGVLFTTFVTDSQKKWLIVSVNKDLLYLLNNLQGSFTLLPLEFFVDIKGKHAKMLYRELCKWNCRTPWYSPEKLATIMGIQTDDKMLVARVNRAVDGAIEELCKYFPGIRVLKRTSRTRGHAVSGYSFAYSSCPLELMKGRKALDAKKDFREKICEKQAEKVGKYKYTRSEADEVLKELQSAEEYIRGTQWRFNGMDDLSGDFIEDFCWLIGLEKLSSDDRLYISFIFDRQPRSFDDLLKLILKGYSENDLLYKWICKETPWAVLSPCLDIADKLRATSTFKIGEKKWSSQRKKSSPRVKDTITIEDKDKL